MMRRSRNALVAEAWVEDRSAPVCLITDAGRLAAENPVGKTGIVRE
jgi:hypothetical protein